MCCVRTVPWVRFNSWAGFHLIAAKEERDEASWHAYDLRSGGVRAQPTLAAKANFELDRISGNTDEKERTYCDILLKQACGVVPAMVRKKSPRVWCGTVEAGAEHKKAWEKESVEKAGSRHHGQRVEERRTARKQEANTGERSGLGENVLRNASEIWKVS